MIRAIWTNFVAIAVGAIAVTLVMSALVFALGMWGGKSISDTLQRFVDHIVALLAVSMAGGLILAPTIKLTSVFQDLMKGKGKLYWILSLSLWTVVLWTLFLGVFGLPKETHQLADVLPAVTSTGLVIGTFLTYLLSPTYNPRNSH